eukprot:2971425-Rhodomonas_salina.1
MLNTWLSALGTQRSALSAQQSAIDTRHPTPDTRHATTLNTNSQHSTTLNTQHSTLDNAQRSTLNTRQRSTLNTQHSALNTQHSALSTQHSTEHSALSTRLATVNTQLSTITPTPRLPIVDLEDRFFLALFCASDVFALRCPVLMSGMTGGQAKEVVGRDDFLRVCSLPTRTRQWIANAFHNSGNVDRDIDV